MKKLFFVLMVYVIPTQFLSAQNVGIGTVSPNSSALLDIQSSNKGLLIPRVTTAQMNSIASPAKGLFVLDTTTNQLMINMGTAIVPNWQSIVIGSGWGLKGNSGTVPFANFIGTTDASPLVFKTKNYVAGVIDTNNVFWGIGPGAFVTSGIANTAIGQSSFYLDTSGSFNTVIGNASMQQNRTGSFNTSAGNSSLFNNRTGNYNVAVGNEAMWRNRKGNANVAMGTGALWSDTSVSNVVAIGDSALFSQIAFPGGGLNTAVGSKSMFSTIDGYANTAVGNRTLYSNTTGSGNTAYGDNSLFNNTTAWNNAAYGNYSLQENTTGDNNVAIGPGAMQYNKTGTNNTALGLYSLASYAASRGASYNTALGAYALFFDSSGVNNIATGYQALFLNTRGSYNSALGTQSLFNHQRGNGNTAVGFQSLYSDTAGSLNTAIGQYSMYWQTGINATNTAVGTYSMYNNKTGTSNAAVGLGTLYSNISGSGNAAIGEDALRYCSSCSVNTAIGYRALYLDTVGSGSTAIGYSALYNEQTTNGAAANTAVGSGALYGTTTGGSNVGLGANTLANNITGVYNTAIGTGANVLNGNQINASAIGGLSRSDCSNCMVLGSIAGINGAPYDVNVGIGTTNPVHARLEINNSIGAAVAMFGANKYGVTIEADNPEVGFNYFYNGGQRTIKAGYASVIGMNTATGETYIGSFNGNQSISDFGPINGYRQNLTLFQSGEFRIAGSVNFSHFYYGGNEDTYIRGGKSSSYVYMADQNTGVVIGSGGPFIGYKLTVQGNEYVNGNLCYSGAFGACSDIRYKTDISYLHDALNIIQQVHPIFYNWKRKEFPAMQFGNDRQLGVSAQELEKFLPELVQTNTEGYKSVDYTRLSPLLIKGMQEQQQQIEALQKENAELKERLLRVEKLILNK